MSSGRMAVLRCALALPADFRCGDVLAFHGRDPARLAETLSPSGFAKGLVWDGLPACLTVDFADGRVRAALAIDTPDGGGETPHGATATHSVGVTAGNSLSAGAGDDALLRLLRRMLGLDQDVAAFEARHRTHPELGPLLRRQAGLRLPAAASPFEALSWAVTGQQISVRAALSLRRRLIEAAGLRHSGGLLCYPDAAAVATLGEPRLRAAGLSATKTRALLALARGALEGSLALDAWLEDGADEDIRDRLLGVPGIGPWTVNYALLRGYGRLDGSLHGDVAVRRGLQRLLGASERIGEAEARAWLEAFSPWRALVAAHLWAMQAAGGN